MRYVAPARGTVDPAVFAQMPLAAWHEYADWLQGPHSPDIDELNTRLPADSPVRFIAQTPELLADGLHYEQRIAERGLIATRQRNWHDLFNALIWLRQPGLKRALNRQQVIELERMGPKLRSRPQCAMTHFDEAGVIVTLRDPALLSLWDAHDWHGLFWRHRQAWIDGTIACELFGHALLELALTPGKLLVGKALVVVDDVGVSSASAIETCAQSVCDGRSLLDPQGLRPLPLAGLPGWYPHNEREAFFRETACFRPVRAGRSYPAPLVPTD